MTSLTTGSTQDPGPGRRTRSDELERVRRRRARGAPPDGAGPDEAVAPGSPGSPGAEDAPGATDAPVPLSVRLAALADRELALIQAGAAAALAIQEERLALFRRMTAPGAPALTAEDRDALRTAARSQMLARESVREREPDRH